jgi:hypothetical protein
LFHLFLHLPGLQDLVLDARFFLLLTFFSFHLGTGTRKFQFLYFIAGSSLLGYTEFMTIGK